MRRKPVREETNTWDPAQESEPALDAALGEIPLPSASPREVLADLFHALNQPLAALRCSCELTLLTPRTPEQYRDCLEIAVQKTEQASLLAKGIREYLEARQTQEETQEESPTRLQLSLREQVRETAEYFLPLASDAGTTLCLDCDDGLPDNSSVKFHPESLRRALFYVFDCVLPLAKAKKVKVHVETHLSEVTLHLSFAANAPAANDDGISCTAQTANKEKIRSSQDNNLQNYWQPKLQWAIAQQLFRARHGRLVMTSINGEFCVQASLPREKPVPRLQPLP
jgi:hypothetical protein